MAQMPISGYPRLRNPKSWPARIASAIGAHELAMRFSDHWMYTWTDDNPTPSSIERITYRERKAWCDKRGMA